MPPRRRRRQRNENVAHASLDNYITVLIVPTGIGAAIGGFAGDALPAARLLATVCDTLVTHPNVLNGALMYWPLSNALYVEGFALDLFATGQLRLQPRRNRANRVGLLLDAGLPPDLRLRHLQAADAARATLGLPITLTTTTCRPLGVTLTTRSSSSSTSSSNANPSWGTLTDPDALLDAARTLQSQGANALAVVANFPEDEEDEDALAEYRAGTGVDAIAGAEAVISHLVTRETLMPCAHAPALPPLDADDTVAPKAAAEELGYTFLSCVLVGLAHAPRLLQPTAHFSDGSSRHHNSRTSGKHYTAANGSDSEYRIDGGIRSIDRADMGIGAEDVDAVVVPADAFGGAAVMALAARGDVLIVAVQENTTALNVSAAAVGIDPARVVVAHSYAEAAGLIAAHRAGILLPSLSARVNPLAPTRSS